MKKRKASNSVLGRIVKLLVAVVLVLGIYMGALVAYDFGYRLFAEQPVSVAPGKDVTIVIEEGTGTSQVADMLEEMGVIRDALVFKVQNKLSHYKGGFMAGTYTINTSMTNEEIMAVLSGEVN